MHPSPASCILFHAFEEFCRVEPDATSWLSSMGERGVQQRYAYTRVWCLLEGTVSKYKALLPPDMLQQRAFTLKVLLVFSCLQCACRHVAA